MDCGKRTKLVAVLLIAVPLFSFNCRVWTQAPVVNIPAVSLLSEEEKPELPQAAPVPTLTPFFQPAQVIEDPPLAQQIGVGQPAGCLSAEAQSALSSPNAMLAYADQLLNLKRPLSDRQVASVKWDSLDLPAADPSVIILDVSDVQNEFVIQRMLNGLFVAGFAAWLRAVPDMDRHIIAVALTDPGHAGLNGGTSAWADYVRTYWITPKSHPDDPYLLPVLKLPPCSWMIERGFAPQVAPEWWESYPLFKPDYAAAAGAYLAGTTQDAIRVARQIDWLYDGSEGPDTMCGPLSWEILNGAQTFPPGWGAWLLGPRMFWLASPRDNGRPWGLFPQESYKLYQFKTALGNFDFSQFPLLPGDFLYTYSYKDGFDHMLVVTEVDEAGNVYTVTNLTAQVPEEKVTIERVLLLNLYDGQVGIARNQWAVDSANGRTGHDGFDVFRWVWAEKDGLAQPAEYIVEPGDTLHLVAVRWRTPAALIAQYNGIAADVGLQVGQRITIPPNPLAE